MNIAPRMIRAMATKNLLLHHQLVQMFLFLRDAHSVEEIAGMFRRTCLAIRLAANRKKIVSRIDQFLENTGSIDQVELDKLVQCPWDLPSMFTYPFLWVMTYGLDGDEANRYVWECFDTALPEVKTADRTDAVLQRVQKRLELIHPQDEKLVRLQTLVLIKDEAHVGLFKPTLRVAPPVDNADSKALGLIRALFAASGMNDIKLDIEEALRAVADDTAANPHIYSIVHEVLGHPEKWLEAMPALTAAVRDYNPKMDWKKIDEFPLPFVLVCIAHHLELTDDRIRILATSNQRLGADIAEPFAESGLAETIAKKAAAIGLGAKIAEAAAARVR